jgi:hypothetical protein
MLREGQIKRDSIIAVRARRGAFATSFCNIAMRENKDAFSVR